MNIDSLIDCLGKPLVALVGLNSYVNDHHTQYYLFAPELISLLLAVWLTARSSAFSYIFQSKFLTQRYRINIDECNTKKYWKFRKIQYVNMYGNFHAIKFINGYLETTIRRDRSVKHYSLNLQIRKHHTNTEHRQGPYQNRPCREKSEPIFF